MSKRNRGRPPLTPQERARRQHESAERGREVDKLIAAERAKTRQSGQAMAWKEARERVAVRLERSPRTLNRKLAAYRALAAAEREQLQQVEHSRPQSLPPHREDPPSITALVKALRGPAPAGILGPPIHLEDPPSITALAKALRVLAPAGILGPPPHREDPPSITGLAKALRGYLPAPAGILGPPAGATYFGIGGHVIRDRGPRNSGSGAT